MKSINFLKKDLISTLVILFVGVVGVATFLPNENFNKFFNLAQIAGNTPQIIDGDLISTSDSFDIYIIKLINDKKFKRLILNSDIFNSYDHLEWENVKTVAQSVQDEYTLSEFVIEVKADGSVADPKVYKVTSAANSDVGQRSWLNLTTAEFESLGYDWDSIYHVNDTEASPDFYPTKDPLTFVDLSPKKEEAETTIVTFSRPDCDMEVPTSHATIQGAVDAASAGDKICVLAGTYNENIEIDGKNIKLSGAGESTTIIKAMRSSETPDLNNASPTSALTLKNLTSAAIIEKFTISNGNYYGLWIEDASPTIQNNIIKDNFAGIRILGNSRPLIKYNVLADNTWGNAIRHNGNFGGYNILNNTFVDNGNTGENAAILFNSEFPNTPIVVGNNIFKGGLWGVRESRPSNITLSYNLFHGQSKAFYRKEFTNYTNASALNDISNANNNLSGDPLLDSNYKPSAGSPAVAAMADQVGNIGVY